MSTAPTLFSLLDSILSAILAFYSFIIGFPFSVAKLLIICEICKLLNGYYTICGIFTIPFEGNLLYSLWLFYYAVCGKTVITLGGDN